MPQSKVTRILKTLWLFAVAATILGCESQGIGEACPEMKIPQEDSVTNEEGAAAERAQGSEVVEQHTRNFANCFVEPVCVITLGNKSPYCSQSCFEPDSCPDGSPCEKGFCLSSSGESQKVACVNDCPQGFSCRTVMNVEPFKDRTFCVWKECEKDSDCGDPWVRQCTVIDELSLGDDTPDTKVCRFRD